MPTPGLLFVSSRIADPKKTSDELYNRFYNDEHLPDVLNHAKEKSGYTKLALRYKNVNGESVMPYLALYPLRDTVFFSSEKESLIEDTRKSKTFNGDDCHDHIEFGSRPYEKIQTFEGYGQAEKTGDERGHTIVCVAMEPKEGEEHDFDLWYRLQHLDMLAMCRGYRRTTRYRRLDGVKPQYLALHEYACEASELPADQIKQVVATEWSQKIIKESPIFDRDVFSLIQAQGETKEKL